jgi:hypothetical protein
MKTPLSWGGVLFLLSLVPGSMVRAQTDGSRAGPEITDALRRLGYQRRTDLKEEAAQRNSTARRIESFVAKNAPLNLVVLSLNRLGYHVCHEVVVAKHEWYVDDNNTPAFATDIPVSIGLSKCSVGEILDAICEEDPRYVWSQDVAHGVFVLAPKEHGRLKFAVGPVKDKGNPVDVLKRLDANSEVPLATQVIRGHNNLPDVQLDLPRCTATELLNEIVGQHPGMTWGFGGRASFNYIPHASADAVKIEFPSLKKGEPADSPWSYDFVERSIKGVSTVVIDKRPRGRVSVATAAPPATKGDTSAPGEKPQNPRPTEQNVVASRLAGSWKLEPALTERLTGRVAAPGDAIVVVADSEVEKKVPAKFWEAAKKEGFTLDVRMAGYIEMRGAKYPFILSSIHGNPHLIYFRERGGDPFGDSESFNLALVPAKEEKNDLLFVGGDFNNQPFRAYARAD